MLNERIKLGKIGTMLYNSQVLEDNKTKNVLMNKLTTDFELSFFDYKIELKGFYKSDIYYTENNEETIKHMNLEDFKDKILNLNKKLINIM